MSLPSQHSASTVRQVSGEPEGTVRGRRSNSRSSSSAALGTSPRTLSIQRLGSPVVGGPRPLPSNSPAISEQEPLAGLETGSLGAGPGRSALASALASYGQEPPQHGTPGVRQASPAAPPSERMSLLDSNPQTYGTPSRLDSPRSQPVEDPEIVKRHLVQPEDIGQRDGESSQAKQPFRRDSPAPSTRTGADADADEFSSLQLQGGDITRQIYRWAEGSDLRSIRAQRSRSFAAPRPERGSEVLDIDKVKAPGGLRRNFLARTGRRQSPSGSEITGALSDDEAFAPRNGQTSNFLEFLTLYGHFGGEELEEEDDDDDLESAIDDEQEATERRPLLSRRMTTERRRKRTLSGPRGNASPGKAAATLLKSFVGTGVLFLPRAFLNGGILFSSVVLVGVAALSYYCFILLVTTQLTVGGSFGDMGELLYGKVLRTMILGSLVLSQIGFVAAYIVFTSQNLQAFIQAVSNCTTFIDIKWMVLMQLIILLPFSLFRDISKLAFTAYIADAFIAIGLIYLYGQDISFLVDQGGLSDVVNFNSKNWTLFIGTAIFTFEGIGLILPIQESMKDPRKFPFILGCVMVFITILFTSIGALSYAAFGSKTQTVVLLNLPQDSKFVNAVQFLYSLAVLLSIPLQLFPAIRILEQSIFKRSGRKNLKVKWLKNFFRFGLSVACAMIAWVGAGDLDKFVSLVGSFACIPLVYVYPPMLHYRGVAGATWQRVLDLILVVFGAIFMVYTTALTIKSWSDGSKPAPGYCDKK